MESLGPDQAAWSNVRWNMSRFTVSKIPKLPNQLLETLIYIFQWYNASFLELDSRTGYFSN
jgi:hypothetical protein